MAYVVKEAQIKPAVTTNTTIYQVTTAKEFVLASLRIQNMGSATEIVRVGVSVTATPGTTEWIFRGEVREFLPVKLSGDLILGDKFIVAYNETGGNCIFKLSGYEKV